MTNEYKTYSQIMDLKEIGYQGVVWIHVAQNRDRWLSVVKTAMNIHIS
jgi:hypothetical protein